MMGEFKPTKVEKYDFELISRHVKIHRTIGFFRKITIPERGTKRLFFNWIQARTCRLCPWWTISTLQFSKIISFKSKNFNYQHFCIFGLSRYGRPEKNIFLTLAHPIKTMFIDVLAGVTRVVFQKHEFECRNMPIVTVIFGSFRIIRITTEGRRSLNFRRNNLSQVITCWLNRGCKKSRC